MGSAVSSHHSCREHGGRLKRVVGNQARGARCGVCQDEVRVEVRERVHRCRKLECTFVLHDRCYRLRATVKRRFGGTEHQLKGLFLGARLRAGIARVYRVVEP
jgi:hypothetical protein